MEDSGQPVMSLGVDGGLSDCRGGRVVFLSHCLLNQNTRYLGGAVSPGVVRGAVEGLVDEGVGIVQMPCPEQRVWGGVLKSHLLWVLDHPRIARAGIVLLALVRCYLRLRYRLVARQVAREVEDYTSSGLEPVAIVGVAGSPSCGVESTLDLSIAARAIRARPPGPVTGGWMNDVVVGGSTRPGTGIFIDELLGELRRRGLEVPVREYMLADPDVGPPGGRT
jgi:predicted secreted protein